MALPKFTKIDGSDPYSWEEGSDLPGDRYDLTMDMSQSNYSIEHQRHGVIYARVILTTLADFMFAWKNISRTMVTEIANFYQLASFRYYPTGAGYYKTIFITGNFEPKSKRGGKFDLVVKVKEI